MAHKRVSGPTPRLVGKALHGTRPSAEHGEAERTKWELQEFLSNLSSASDQTQEDVAALEALILAALGLEEIPDPPDPRGLHIFHLMGA